MKLNKKAKGNVLITIGAIVVIISFLFMALAFTGVIQLKGVPDEKREDLPPDEPVGGDEFSRYSLDLFFRAIDGAAAQDADSDLEYDIFVWDETKNADLVDDGIMDCSGVTPVKFDGKSTVYTITNDNKCKMNFYKFFRDSSYNGANEETKIDDSLTPYEVDQGENASPSLLSGEEYLIVVTESASTDTFDVEPFAFIMTSTKTTTLNQESIEAGTVKIQINYRYYSDAVEHSKVSMGGSCDDSTGNSPNLGTSLDNALHSGTVGQPTNFDLDCEIEVTIDSNGYRTFFENPMAESDTERAYIRAYPYVVGYNVTFDGGVIQKITSPALSGTGVVKFATTPAATGNYTMMQSLSVCGKEITNNDATDANVNIGSKLYQGEDIDCLKDAFDKGGKVTIPVKMVDIIAINYSRPTCTHTTESINCADEIVGNGDKLLNVSITHLAGSTEVITSELTA
jgi:hypothetical protein